MYQSLNLSHADAQEILDAIRKRAEAEKKTGAIAVTDSHGELLAFLRLDGCLLAPIQISMNKAFTAAREHRPSAELGERARESFPLVYFGDLRYTGFIGGTPIVVDGQVVGAIGISGMDEKSEAELGAWAAEQFARTARQRPR